MVVATPERPSAALIVTVTGLVYHPRKPLVPFSVASVIGGVLSMLMPLKLVVAVLSALSVADPEVACVAPSVANVLALEHVATPETASAHWKVTVTVLFVQVPGA